MSQETQKAAAAPTEGQKAQNISGIGGSIAWGEVGVRPPGSGNQSGNGDRKVLPYLTLEEGKTFKIRLIDKPYKFYRHYEVIRAISPGFEKDVCWQAGHTPRERYAILVLDRNDNNKMKFLEGGPLIFKEFKSYYELTNGKNPGGLDGPDWLISVKVPVKVKDGRQFKDKRKTEYHVMRDETAKFTPAEMAFIKENWVDLAKQYQPTSPELVAEMFEYAKTRNDSDPIPGTKEWWKARREKKQENANSSSNEQPLVPNTEPEAQENSKTEEKSEVKTAGDNGFGGLFDEKETSKKSTQF